MSLAGSKNTPESKAREKIDALLEQSGWVVQDRDEMRVASEALVNAGAGSARAP